MCSQCENCRHAKYRAARINCPVEDSYPAESWCSCDNDNFYMDDEEIKSELVAEQIEMMKEKGHEPTDEEIDELYEDCEVECEDFDYDSRYDDYYPPEPPETW